MYEQAYIDIPFAKRDCEYARRFFQREYNVLDEDIIEVHNKGRQEIRKVIYGLLSTIMKIQPQKVLIFHVYAGHGVQESGMQSLLVNEFSQKFYWRFNAEALIRTMSQKAQNAYHVVFYACCRERERKYEDYLSEAQAREQYKAHKDKRAEIIKRQMQEALKQQYHETKLEMEESKRMSEQSQVGRGFQTESHAADLQRENWLMVYGTDPTKQVKIDTKFVKNILDHMLYRQDHTKKVASLPGVFDQIQTDDAKFEISASNTIERLDLYHRDSKFKAKFDNEVGDQIGIIFVNTTSKGLQFRSSEANMDINHHMRRHISTEAFKNYYKVTDKNLLIKVDPTKDQVIQAFKDLEERARRFLEKNKRHHVLSVLVRWIGWDVELSRKDFVIENNIGRKIQVQAFQRDPVDGPTRNFSYKGQRVEFDRYGLTKDGEGVCVDAYCLSIASLPSTFVTLLMDRDEYGQVKEENIDWQKPFNELTNGEKPILSNDLISTALDRFCSFHYDKVSEFHINKKDRGLWNQKVHIVPSLYKYIDKKYHGEWMSHYSFPFQIVYDFREQQEKALQQQFKSENTFKLDIDVWEDKPYIQKSIQVQNDHYSHNATTYHLSHQNTILFITSFFDEKRRICVSQIKFFEDQAPFRETSKQITIQLASSEIRVMLVQDLRTNRTEAEKDEVMLIIDASQIKRFQRLTYDSSLHEFEAKALEKINTSLKNHRDIAFKQVVNTFRLDGDLICLATTKGFLVFDKEFVLLQRLSYKQFLGPMYAREGTSLSCVPSFEQDGKNFLISFTHGDTIAQDLRSANVMKSRSAMDAENEFTSLFGSYNIDITAKTKDTPNWVAKFRFNEKTNLIEHPDDMREESILIMLGNVPTIDEYQKDRILMVASQSLLLFENWHCLREYKDNDPQNYYTISLNRGLSVLPIGNMCLLPIQEIEDTSLVLLAGAKTISLINLNDQYIEPFIIAENPTAFSQPSFFFKVENFGLSLHFTIKRTINQQNIRLNWCRMPFKPDFLEILKRYSRLPFTNTQEALQLKRLEEAATEKGARILLDENMKLRKEKDHLIAKIQFLQTKLKEEETEQKEELARKDAQLQKKLAQERAKSEETITAALAREHKMKAEIERLQKITQQQKCLLESDTRYQSTIALIDRQRLGTRKALQLAAQNMREQMREKAQIEHESQGIRVQSQMGDNSFFITHGREHEEKRQSSKLQKRLEMLSILSTIEIPMIDDGFMKNRREQQSSMARHNSLARQSSAKKNAPTDQERAELQRIESFINGGNDTEKVSLPSITRYSQSLMCDSIKILRVCILLLLRRKQKKIKIYFENQMLMSPMIKLDRKKSSKK